MFFGIDQFEMFSVSAGTVLTQVVNMMAGGNGTDKRFNDKDMDAGPPAVQRGATITGPIALPWPDHAAGFKNRRRLGDEALQYLLDGGEFHTISFVNSWG
jgi:hypothetical protein